MNQRTRTPLVIGLVVAVVVIVAVVVVLATGDDDEAETSSSTTAASASVDDGTGGDSSADTLPAILVGEVRPVTVDGSPLPVFEGDDDDPAIGMTPPTLTGEGFDGSQVVVGADESVPTLVVFLAHWCPHCNAEVPRLVQLNDEGRIPENLRVVGVSIAADPNRPNFPPSEWFADTGWPFEVMADDEVATGANAYGLTAFPYMTMIGSDGTVVDRWSGESEVDELAERIAAGAAA